MIDEQLAELQRLLEIVQCSLIEAAKSIATKDAEIERLRDALADAVELTDAAIDPRYGSKDDWEWRDEVLAKMRAELGPAAQTPP